MEKGSRKRKKDESVRCKTDRERMGKKGSKNKEEKKARGEKKNRTRITR